jgi:hypothetical protein
MSRDGVTAPLVNDALPAPKDAARDGLDANDDVSSTVDAVVNGDVDVVPNLAAANGLRQPVVGVLLELVELGHIFGFLGRPE